MSAPTATAAEVPIDLGEVYLRSTEAVTAEVDVSLPVVEGAVPPGLRGVLFRGQQARQLLAPHGQVLQLSFEAGNTGLRGFERSL